MVEPTTDRKSVDVKQASVEPAKLPPTPKLKTAPVYSGITEKDALLIADLAHEFGLAAAALKTGDTATLVSLQAKWRNLERQSARVRGVLRRAIG